MKVSHGGPIVCKHNRGLIDFQDQLALLDWNGLLWEKEGDKKSKQLVSEHDGNRKLSSHVKSSTGYF